MNKWNNKFRYQVASCWLFILSYRFCFSISANDKHSLLQSIPIHFPTILCELTHYTNIHEQQPYCLGTLSQMTERTAERSVRQETGWLAGGPLLRVPTTKRTTDTFRFISHTTNELLFKFRCNIFIGVRIIKEIPGSVASGTPCTYNCDSTVISKTRANQLILELFSYSAAQKNVKIIY